MDFRARAKELVKGSIDFHIHSGPDVFPRKMNDIEVAEKAKAAGMRAILLKSHVENMGSRAQIATAITGFPVYGGLALNYPAGGLNVEAVKSAIRTGIKEVWLPTIHAAHYLRDVDQVPMFAKLLKKGMKGIYILNDDGSLKDEVKEIIECIAEADIAFATGHISIPEAIAAVDAAKKAGVKKIIVTHPTSPMEAYTNEEMQHMVTLGAAMLEHVVNDITHQMKNPIRPSTIADAIKVVGVANTIMSTDSGQVINPPPVESMENFIYEMLALGIPEEDIRTMTRNNPAAMLGIDL